MPILTQSDLPPIPKDLQRKSTLTFNPFEEGQIDFDSVKFNQGQYIDALTKISAGQPLNNKLPESASDFKAPITEEEAFAAGEDILQDPTGIWADPSNYQNLSKVQLAELERANPELYKSHVSKFEANIRGNQDIPTTFLPDFTSEKAVDKTQERAGGWAKQMKAEGVPGILKPRERTLGSEDYKFKKKNYSLKESDKTALSNIVNDMERHIKNPAEQSFLSEMATGSSLVGGGQTNIEVIENDLGVNDQNRKHFTSVVTLALTNFADIMKKHKHDQQIVGNYLGIDPSEIETDTNAIDVKKMSAKEIFAAMKAPRDPSKKKGMSKEQSLKELASGVELRNKQPIINGMMNTLDKFIRKVMNPDGLASATPSKSLKGAGSILRYWTEQGYLQWGRTAKGYITPIVKSNYKIGNISETEIATAFDPSLRQKRYSTVNAPTYPAVSNITNASKADWESFTRYKDLKGRSSVSKAFLAMEKSNPKRINGENLFFEKSMLSELEKFVEEKGGGFVGGIDHPLASTLGEIDKAAYDIYIRRDAAAARHPEDGVARPLANSLVKTHFQTIKNKVFDINNKFKEQEAGNYKYYPLWYKSGPNGRYFVMDSLFNHINDKGLIRPLLKIGHDVPISMNTPISKDRNRVLNLAKDVYKPRGKGIFFGQNINKRLQELPASERQLLGFYYALGKTANKYKIREYGKVIENPVEAIENGIEAFDAMAAEGTQLRAMLPTKENPEGAFPKYNAMTPTQKSFFGNNKGEWNVPVGLAMNASKFKEAIANNDNQFTFDFTFEEDARQSNAALISTLIGDPKISGLLGLLPEEAKQKRDPRTGRLQDAKDLRDLLTATLPETVATVINNDQPLEKRRAEALTTYFNNVLEDSSLNGSKVITRGLIVAGLYGKYPGYMYTEAENMLAQTPAHLNILNEAYAKNSAETGTEIDHESLSQDISQVYLSLAYEHMGNLMGYQSLMKSTGRILGVLDGATEIKGVLPEERVMLAINDLYPIETMSDDKVVGDAIIRETEEVGGFNFPIFNRQTRAINTSPTVYQQRIVGAMRDKGGIAPIAGMPETESFEQLGSQVSRAFPVNVIQNMDSLALAMSFMIAHGSNKQTPPAATAVHDAILSTADSVLTLNNAYNNIVPHVFVQGGKPFFEQLQELLHGDTVVPLLQIDDDTNINIGTDIVLKKGGGLKQYSGVTNYFDEIYKKTLPQNSFFTETQLEREAFQGAELQGETNKEVAAKMLADNQSFIRVAQSKYGYLPPSPENNLKRKNYSVKGKQFKALIMMMLEQEGLLTYELHNQGYKLMGYDNVSERKEAWRNFKQGKTYDKIMKSLDDNAKRKWSEQNTYNRQLD